MAHLIVSMNLSLDGYIEAQGEDDGSWLSIDEEVHVAFNQLAAGAPFFRQRTSLELTDHRRFQNGALLLRYARRASR